MTRRFTFRSSDERTRDALWALLAAVLISLFGINEPITQYLRAVQSTFAPRAMSGDIAFATSRNSLTDPRTPEQRMQLASFLRQAKDANVEHIYIDAVFERESTQEADRELRDAIQGLGDRVTLVWRLSNAETGTFTKVSSIPAIAGDAAQVPNMKTRGYFGFAWEVPSRVRFGGITEDSLPLVLADKKATEEIPVDYQFDAATLPVFDIDRKLATDDLRLLHGRKIVVGQPASAEPYEIKIPGLQNAPTSFVAIYAAETLKRGGLTVVSDILILLSFAVLLLAICRFTSNRKGRRENLYFVLTLALGALIIVPVFSHVRADAGYPIVLLGWFGFLRIRSRWQKRFALEDPKTGLPTFRAFEQKLAEDGNPAAIVVAKIQGYEDVVKTLPVEHHAAYVRGLLERFRVAEKDLPIYANEGRYFAWTSNEAHVDGLEAHLDGLRALFASPIMVGGVEVDVGITFGVDMSAEPDAVQRIASAVSAAERTDEAHRPIMFAQLDEKSDALWKLSLQARIDNALANEEIYLVYQPKLDIETGQMVGAEALVRWDDPARGHISPAYFVQECERAGRMDHLTEYVLRHASRASVELQQRGLVGKMSVNISATLLRDGRVEHMVKRVLDEEGLDPRQLVLEVTETARIVDLDKAVDVLERIRALGVSISIDDFGAGAANLEMLYRLPFDELKIDRVFIANLENEKSSAIVESIIGFGKSMRINVVAEGAESAATIIKLNELGCRIVQGYAISPPREFERLLEFQEVDDFGATRNMV